MANQGTSKSYTEPKGHPTRSRSGPPRRRRVIGPGLQWTGLVVLGLLLVWLLVQATT